MRIALLGVWHESNSFAPFRVDEDYVRAAGILTGNQVLEVHRGLATTMGGYIAGCERFRDVEMIPIELTTLIPGGAFTREAMLARTEALVDGLRRLGPFDAVLVVLHGSALAEGADDFDGHVLAQLRGVVGPSVPIGVSLDMHANVSPAMVANSTILNTYRTNPHVDAHLVAEEVAVGIIRTVLGQLQPVQELIQVPAAINILQQNTSSEPMCHLLSELAQVRGDSGVITASIAEGYPYADVPEMGMSVVVVTDGDRRRAREHAARLATEVWACRDEFIGEAPDLQAALLAAADISARPVLLLDMGDNIGGGAPGDSAAILREARECGISSLLTIIYDPAAVAGCRDAAIGSSVSLSIGSWADDRTGHPVEATCTVVARHDGRFQATEAVHAGWYEFDAGESVAVVLDTGQTVILQSNPSPPFSPAQVTAMGLTLRDFQVIAAKGVHSPLAGYQPHTAATIWANTPGAACADFTSFEFTRRRRPMFPFERDFEWSPN